MNAGSDELSLSAHADRNIAPTATFEASWIEALTGAPAYDYQEAELSGANWFVRAANGLVHEKLWQQFRSDGDLHFREVFRSTNGFRWEHTMKPADELRPDDRFYVRASGQTDTAEQAVAAAVAHVFQVEVIGETTWYSGDPERSNAQINGEEAEVFRLKLLGVDGGEEWHWTRRMESVEAISRRFFGRHGGVFEGRSATRAEAICAALNAPVNFAAACIEFLAGEQVDMFQAGRAAGLSQAMAAITALQVKS